jgi:hypothetical protein
MRGPDEALERHRTGIYGREATDGG